MLMKEAGVRLVGYNALSLLLRKAEVEIMQREVGEETSASITPQLVRYNSDYRHWGEETPASITPPKPVEPTQPSPVKVVKDAPPKPADVPPTPKPPKQEIKGKEQPVWPYSIVYIILAVGAIVLYNKWSKPKYEESIATDSTSMMSTDTTVMMDTTVTEVDSAAATPYEPSEGRVVFWTNDSGPDNDIYVDGKYVGKLTKYTTDTLSTPSCGDAGWLTVTLKPGEHKFRSTNSAGITWENTFNVEAGVCGNLFLSKSE
jgi:hypothetical protein